MRLVPPIYVKPFVKRHKNNAARAEAVCEAASCPGMRFAAALSAEQQGEAIQLFGIRNILTISGSQPRSQTRYAGGRRSTTS